MWGKGTVSCRWSWPCWSFQPTRMKSILSKQKKNTDSLYSLSMKWCQILPAKLVVPGRVWGKRETRVKSNSTIVSFCYLYSSSSSLNPQFPSSPQTSAFMGFQLRIPNVPIVILKHNITVFNNDDYIPFVRPVLYKRAVWWWFPLDSWYTLIFESLPCTI